MNDFNIDTNKKVADLKYEYLEFNSGYSSIYGNKDFIKPFDIIRLIGQDRYAISTNLLSRKTLEQCCHHCSALYHEISKLYEKFPNCCNFHRKIAKESWFNINNYSNLPNRVIKQLFFTIHLMNMRHNKEDWFKDITHYIEYSIFTFGIPGIGSEWYIYSLLSKLRFSEDIHLKMPNDKKQVIAKYVQSIIDNSNQLKKKKKYADFENLIQIFRKWLDLFPNLIYFKKFKEDMKNEFIGIMIEDIDYNPYLKLSPIKICSQKTLVKNLIFFTKKILDQIDTIDLIERGLITDKDAYKINLIKEEKRVVYRILLRKFSKKEKKYANVLNDWLKKEKEIFGSVEYLFAKTDKSSETKDKELPNLRQRQIALYYRYLVLAELSDPINIDNRNEIAKTFGFTATGSGKKIYDWFNKLNNTTQRTAKGRNTLKDLKKVIAVLELHPSAKKRAEDELKTAEKLNA